MNGFPNQIRKMGSRHSVKQREREALPARRRKKNNSRQILVVRMELPIEPKDSPWSGEDKGETKEVKKVYIYIYIFRHGDSNSGLERERLL